ncbi:MAG TPA: orotate phosphoribosyltransferase, partial [Alphaproteobacteria bacterium]|nr:orotate phosphoribosyltransferase [Alphaproteobacteria bacterium]
MSASTPPPARGSAAYATARALLEIKAVNFSPDKPFTFTSGRLAPVYIDCRKIISFPRARAELMDLAVIEIERAAGRGAFDAIAGGETAGIPFAAWIAERMDLPMLYVRKQAKGFGRMAQIEGDMKEGTRVLLVEDLATDGGSKLAFVEALRKAGAEVAHNFVVFHYGIFPEGIARLEAAGVKLTALATWWDTIAVAEAEGYFPRDVLQKVRSFLDDPDGWQKAHAAG